ncbi:colicin V family bacteriocin [Escherichia coli]|uniref:colicin V family bacteriocin n=1 Tax=Escherichia coli TaxID=562 RepID=UPI00372D313E
MREITLNEMNNVSGAGDVNWVDVGKTVATNGAGVIGGAFGAGLCGPVCAGAFAVGSSAAVAALYDAAGNSNSAKQKPEGLPPETWNYAEGRMCNWSPNNLSDVCL